VKTPPGQLIESGALEKLCAGYGLRYELPGVVSGRSVSPVRTAHPTVGHAPDARSQLT